MRSCATALVFSHHNSHPVLPVLRRAAALWKGAKHYDHTYSISSHPYTYVCTHTTPCPPRYRIPPGDDDSTPTFAPSPAVSKDVFFSVCTACRLRVSSIHPVWKYIHCSTPIIRAPSRMPSTVFPKHLHCAVPRTFLLAPILHTAAPLCGALTQKSEWLSLQVCTHAR